MGQRTNEGDIAEVTEVVRTYYDGMVAGDETKLARAFHPRACIVGNEHGAFAWATLEEFVAECRTLVAEAGPHEWRIDGLSFEGDTALVRLGGQFAGVVQRRSVNGPDRRRLAHRPQDVLRPPRKLTSSSSATARGTCRQVPKLRDAR